MVRSEHAGKPRAWWRLINREALILMVAPAAVVGSLTVLFADIRPSDERNERARLCRQSVQELVKATDSAAVARSTFLIRELRCDVVKASLAR